MIGRRRFVVIAGAAASAGAANWPNWRGPGNHGVADEKSLPRRWGRTEGVRWRVPLAEPGNSTPIVWGDRLFLTQPLARLNQRTLLCLDRVTGKKLWQAGIGWPETELTHKTNPFASASAVTDGRRVAAWFGSAGLAAYDLHGRELWRRDLGRQKHVWGYGGSPILYGALVILNFGPGDPSFLIAVDARSGKTVWKVDLTPRLSEEEVRQAGELAPRADGAVRADFYGSWTTPIVVRAANRDELVFNLPRRVAAFDPQTGRELWTCGGFGDLAYGSPVLGYDETGPLVCSLGGFGGAGLVVRAGGNGDVTTTHRLWQVPRTPQRIGSSVIHGGHIYTVANNGVAECFELRTGKPTWTERLRGSSGDNGIWSSLVRHGETLYVMNKSGDTFLYRAAPKFELIGVNSLGEDSNSSVVASHGNLFLRTHESLWCIGA